MANIFKREPKKAPVSPEIGGAALLGAVVVSVVAIDLTRAGVRWVGSKARQMFSAPAEPEVLQSAAPVSQVAAPVAEADGNVAESVQA